MSRKPSKFRKAKRAQRARAQPDPYADSVMVKLSDAEHSFDNGETWHKGDVVEGIRTLMKREK